MDKGRFAGMFAGMLASVVEGCLGGVRSSRGRVTRCDQVQTLERKTF